MCWPLLPSFAYPLVSPSASPSHPHSFPLLSLSRPAEQVTIRLLASAEQSASRTRKAPLQLGAMSLLSHLHALMVAAQTCTDFDCSRVRNELDTSPGGITCAGYPCSAYECCTVAPTAAPRWEELEEPNTTGNGTVVVVVIVVVVVMIQLGMAYKLCCSDSDDSDSNDSPEERREQSPEERRKQLEDRLAKVRDAVEEP